MARKVMTSAEIKAAVKRLLAERAADPAYQKGTPEYAARLKSVAAQRQATREAAHRRKYPHLYDTDTGERLPTGEPAASTNPFDQARGAVDYDFIARANRAYNQNIGRGVTGVGGFGRNATMAAFARERDLAQGELGIRQSDQALRAKQIEGNLAAQREALEQRKLEAQMNQSLQMARLSLERNALNRRRTDSYGGGSRGMSGGFSIRPSSGSPMPGSTGSLMNNRAYLGANRRV